MTDDFFDDPLEHALRSLKGPLDWRRLHSTHAVAEWAALRDWVNWLRTRFGLDHRIIPPCWYQHPALIDLLTALRDHHRLAYDPVQPASGATDWHRTFRDLEPRLRDWASRTSCTPDTHRLDQPIPAPDDSVHWEQHQHADIRRRQQDEGERTP